MLASCVTGNRQPAWQPDYGDPPADCPRAAYQWPTLRHQMATPCAGGVGPPLGRWFRRPSVIEVAPPLCRQPGPRCWQPGNAAVADGAGGNGRPPICRHFALPATRQCGRTRSLARIEKPPFCRRAGNPHCRQRGNVATWHNGWSRGLTCSLPIRQVHHRPTLAPPTCRQQSLTARLGGGLKPCPSAAHRRLKPALPLCQQPTGADKTAMRPRRFR